ncbi:hypothetical protein BDN72DRAFT_956161 [Pluteus cervinus]|uniref:Uncharacterized protein n=1 Tax=Pluteus cervinus TaxID=181527 RepID=A0ACD3B7Z7_9AGAR|nr:hypothetical protein BDN72DRAFT_956161 [Pluteus cervinus]
MATDNHHVDPVLPLEIERIILQMALKNDMNNAKNLLFICKDVFDWLIPTLYNVVVLTSHKGYAWPPLRLPIAKLPQYGPHVRHLSIMWIPDTVVDQYLQSCPNIVDLARSEEFSQSQIEHIARLPLRQLELNSKDARSIPMTPSILALFSKITHLHAEELKVQYLSYFPSLTHLVLGMDVERKVFIEVLEQRPGLQVLMVRLYFHSLRIPEVTLGEVITGLDDPRVVYLNYSVENSWKMKAMGDPRNAWSLSERTVESRLAVARAQRLS